MPITLPHWSSGASDQHIDLKPGMILQARQGIHTAAAGRIKEGTVMRLERKLAPHAWEVRIGWDLVVVCESVMQQYCVLISGG